MQNQTPNERASQVCREYRESGLSQKEFCERHRVYRTTLSYWLKKEREQAETQPLVQVASKAVSSASGALRVRIGLDLSQVTVYVRTGVTDMPKVVNGLSILVAEQMALEPLSEMLFVLSNRQRRILKALYWDHHGFHLRQKRHERYRPLNWGCS
jgi:transposase-like protein